MRPRYSFIESLVEEVIEKAGIKKAPVNLTKVSKAFDIEIDESRTFNGELLGAAILKNGSKMVLVEKNILHAGRKRFTIAHEIGHILLHDEEMIMHDQNALIYFRDDNSTKGTDTKEVEANYFAASLLMPKHLVQKEFEKLVATSISTENWVEKLAEKFNVSNTAMALRLGKLGFIAE